MSGFLDDFLKGKAESAPVPTDPLPLGTRDMLLLDEDYYAAEACDTHDHSGDEKIGGCGQSCGGCAQRGTPACHELHP